MLKAWKEMEEKASQCAQVGNIKEASLSLCEGDHDRNLVSYVPLPCPFSVFPCCGNENIIADALKKKQSPVASLFESSDLNKASANVTFIDSVV